MCSGPLSPRQSAVTEACTRDERLKPNYKRTVYGVEVRRKSYSTVDGATSPIDCL